jgi:hypothetical protein
MESLALFWSLILLLSTFLFPQLIGALLHFRLVHRSRWLAFVLGLLVPPALFFYLARLLFFAGLPEVQQAGCGMPGLAAAMMLLAGTAAELIVAMPIQGYLFCQKRPH